MNFEEGLVFCGSERKSFGDKICALALALVPILQHYKGIIENSGFTVLLLISPLLLLKTFNKLKVGVVNKKTFYAIIPLLLFFLYTVFVRDIDIMRLGYVLLLSLVFFSISNGSINISLFFKYATRISILATIAIAIQYISHYIFRRTIDFRPLSLLVSQNVIWVKNAVNLGAIGRTYRPAGFFLEPSHFFLYSFPIIAVLLLSANNNKPRFRTALFLSLGLVLSTSGMGIAVALGLWVLYYALYRNAKNNNVMISKLLNVRTVLVLLIFGILFLLAYQFIPFFQNSVDRIFVEDETTNAIDGRVRLAQNYVKSISGKAVWFGTPGVTQELNFNLSGFFATYIRWGIIGLILSYWFYVRGLFKLKGAYFWISLIIVFISYFTAHTHGTFYMIYFGVFLLNGYYGISLKKGTVSKF